MYETNKKKQEKLAFIVKFYVLLNYTKLNPKS